MGCETSSSRIIERVRYGSTERFHPGLQTSFLWNSGNRYSDGELPSAEGSVHGTKIVTLSVSWGARSPRTNSRFVCLGTYFIKPVGDLPQTPTDTDLRLHGIRSTGEA